MVIESMACYYRYGRWLQKSLESIHSHLCVTVKNPKNLGSWNSLVHWCSHYCSETMKIQERCGPDHVIWRWGNLRRCGVHVIMMPQWCNLSLSMWLTSQLHCSGLTTCDISTHWGNSCFIVATWVWSGDDQLWLPHCLTIHWCSTSIPDHHSIGEKGWGLGIRGWPPDQCNSSIIVCSNVDISGGRWKTYM